MRALFLTTMIVITGCGPGIVQARRPRPAEGAASRSASPQSSRALVFVSTTGLEDLQTMSSVFRHARTAAEQGRLSEVVVLVYGRGIEAFDGDIAHRPDSLVQSIRAAMGAGVRVLLCANAMEQMGIRRERLDPLPTEVVPNAIATLVDYVAGGAAVVRY